MTNAKSSTLAAVIAGMMISGTPLVTFAMGEADTNKTKVETKKDEKAKDENKTAESDKKCFFGKVYDEEQKKCIKKEKSSSLDQDEIYFKGRQFARDGKFEKAIKVLATAPNQYDPRVLNYLGYSNRKLGNIEVALRYYHAAVATKPDFTLAMEYLGEAYIQLGELEKAREQLSKIESLCGGKDCAEYAQLSKMLIKSQTQ